MAERTSKACNAFICFSVSTVNWNDNIRLPPSLSANMQYCAIMRNINVVYIAHYGAMRGSCSNDLANKSLRGYRAPELGVRGIPSPFINLDERGRDTPYPQPPYS